MAEKPYDQSFQKHMRMVPGFHYLTFGILAINVLWSFYQAIRAFSGGTVIAAALSVALVLMFFYSRIFALCVQDRVIRLEERLRMERVLPPEMRPRIAEFSAAQLVALRFASDEELPGLARKVLDERITERKAIKQLIRNWRPDFLRA